MDIETPLRLTQGDMSGTPIAMVELRRKQGRLTVEDTLLPDPDTISYELVWGECAARQTGYHKAAMLKDGRVLLYEPLRVRDLEALGGPLPQDPSGTSNADQARRQRDEREGARVHSAESTALDRAKAALS